MADFHRSLRKAATWGSVSHAFIGIHQAVDAFCRSTGEPFSAVFARLERSDGFSRRDERRWPGLEQIRAAARSLEVERHRRLVRREALIAIRRADKRAGRRAFADELDRLEAHARTTRPPAVGTWGWGRVDGWRAGGALAARSRAHFWCRAPMAITEVCRRLGAAFGLPAPLAWDFENVREHGEAALLKGRLRLNVSRRHRDGDSLPDETLQMLLAGEASPSDLVTVGATRSKSSPACGSAGGPMTAQRRPRRSSRPARVSARRSGNRSRPRLRRARSPPRPRPRRSQRPPRRPGSRARRRPSTSPRG